MSGRTMPFAIVLLASLVAPFVGGCANISATNERAFIAISREQEIYMGQQAAPQFEQEFGGKVPDAALQAYVNEVGMKLAAVSDRSDMPYTFTLVASDVPNAFALPGGNIFITAGLMARMNNERELAAVLGHEVGHVAAYHNVRGLQQQMGVAALAKLAGVIIGGEKGKAAESVATLVLNMKTLQYSREFEYAADGLGIRYAAKAGYNPYGMVELLTVLEGMSRTEGGKFEEMFRSHPLTGNRIENARGIIGDNAAYRAFSPDTPDPNTGRFQQMRQQLVRNLGW